MKKILSDHQKAVRIIPLRWWTVTAVEFALCFFIGAFRSEGISKILAIASTAFFSAVSAVITIIAFWITPMKFKKRMNSFSETEQNSIAEQYERSAAELGYRRFLDEYLICFIGLKILLLKFSEIRSVGLKGYELLLDTGGKKPVKMPFGAEENPAILVAAMRSRNPKISVIINGKAVE